MKFLRIDYPGIAWQTASIMLHVIGAAAVLGWLAGMPVWTWPFSLLAITVCFYSGYYFNLGFRQRRWSEFRYGGEKMPKQSFDALRWRERRDKNLENKNCDYCGKLFCPIHPQESFCSAECENAKVSEYQQTLGDA